MDPKALRTRAEKGEAEAQFQLGRAYRAGDGVPRDISQARHWYRAAAIQGHAAAQDSLGELPAPGSFWDWVETTSPERVYALLAVALLILVPGVFLAGFMAYWHLGAVLGPGAALALVSAGIFVLYTAIGRFGAGQTIAESIVSAFFIAVMFAAAAPKTKSLIERRAARAEAPARPPPTRP